MINKDEIRKVNKEKRAQMTKEEVLEKSHRASEAFLKSDLYKRSAQIMLYLPLGNELDVSEVLKRALGDKKTVLVPSTDPERFEITPLKVEGESEFRKGTFSVLEPKVKIKGDIKKTDVVIVPGIAFDKSGARVGFGKGCYDKLLGKSDATFVGACFDFQISSEIEIEKTDIKMDFLMTESGIFECSI